MEGKYITHRENANDAKIRGEEVIQVVFIQVLEQDVQPHQHHTATNREHPCIVRRHHIHRRLIVLIGGTLCRRVLGDFSLERRGHGMLQISLRGGGRGEARGTLREANEPK